MYMRMMILAVLAAAGLAGCESVRINPSPAAPVARIVQIGSVPATPEAFADLQKDLCRTPEGAAAAMVTVMLACNQNEKLGMTFATMLLHPDRLRTGNLYEGREPGQHYRDMLRIAAAKPFIARSYLVGAMPTNDDQPEPPLRIRWQPHAQPTPSPGRYRLLLPSSGADYPRPVTLRRDDAGLWKVEESSSLFVGVRPPAGN